MDHSRERRSHSSDGLTIPIPGADAGPSQPGCQVRESADGFALQALDNGTPVFVNGLPVTTRRLEPHDELRIGDSLFIVQRRRTRCASPR